jgi:hypothetical protein
MIKDAVMRAYLRRINHQVIEIVIDLAGDTLSSDVLQFNQPSNIEVTELEVFI